MIYKLFGSATYYPGGGYHDFISAHATIEAAREALRGLPHPWKVHDYTKETCEWAHIVFDDKIVERWQARFAAKGWVQEVES